MIVSRFSRPDPPRSASASPPPEAPQEPSEWTDKLTVIGFAAGAGAVLGTVGALTGRVSFAVPVGAVLGGGAAYAMGRGLDKEARKGAALGGVMLGALAGGAVGALAGLTMALRE